MVKLQGKLGVTVVNDEKQMKETFGEDIAKQITGKIDFATEDLVHVGWESFGPPFGDLLFEANNGKNITFYIKEPKVEMRGAAYRGAAYRLGNAFFAVPKKAEIKFDGRK